MSAPYGDRSTIRNHSDFSACLQYSISSGGQPTSSAIHYKCPISSVPSRHSAEIKGREHSAPNTGRQPGAGAAQGQPGAAEAVQQGRAARSEVKTGAKPTAASQ